MNNAEVFNTSKKIAKEFIDQLSNNDNSNLKLTIASFSTEYSYIYKNGVNLNIFY